MLVADLLLDAVGAEARDLAADVEAGLVDRVAEVVARVAADHQRPPLGHERARVPDRAVDDDVRPLDRDPAARRGAALGSPAGRRARRRPPTGSRRRRRRPCRTSCSRPPRCRSCPAPARWRACSSRRSSSRRGRRSRPRPRQSSPTAIEWAPLGFVTRQREPRGVELVQALVQLPHRDPGQVDGLDRGVGAAHPTIARCHEYTRPGSGSHSSASSAPGSTAIARYSDAIATQSSLSASTAGLQAIGSRRTAKPSVVPTAKV